MQGRRQQTVGDQVKMGGGGFGDVDEGAKMKIEEGWLCC